MFRTHGTSQKPCKDSINPAPILLDPDANCDRIITMTLTKQMTDALDAYIQHLNRDYAAMYPDGIPSYAPVYSYKVGQKFIKVISSSSGSRSVHSFINLKHPKFFPGDVLKAAGWAAPALNAARGNILTGDWGASWTGAAYLR